MLKGANKQLLAREVKCPVCDKDYVTQVIKGSSIKLDTRDSDFRGTYVGENPIYYGIYVCPHCGYSGFETDYKNIKDNEKQIISDKIGAKWKYKDYGKERSREEAIMTYKLALLNYNILQRKPSQVAKICLRIAWLYREWNDVEEKNYIEHAAKSFENAYSTEPLEEDVENELTTLFLLGELNRRLGNLKESIQWFRMCVQNPQIKKFKHLEASAREQWGVAGDEFKAKKKAEEE